MSKPQLTPLSSTLIARKGEAAPLSLNRQEPVLKAVEPKPAAAAAAPEVASKPADTAPVKAEKAAPVEEPKVPHNFRVPKKFKRAFDQAAFDEEMTGVDFLQHVFAFYRKHHRG